MCRVGPADGGGDEGVGSNWSGVCHSPLELPSHVTDMEGKGQRVTSSILPYHPTPHVGVSSTGHGEHCGPQTSYLHQT